MKVGQSSAVLPPEPPTTPAPKPASTPVVDTTNLSSVIGAAQQSVEETRVARVQELAAQVKSGSYPPNPQAIADAILDEAMIDAELEAQG